MTGWSYLFYATAGYEHAQITRPVLVIAFLRQHFAVMLLRRGLAHAVD